MARSLGKPSGIPEILNRIAGKIPPLTPIGAERQFDYPFPLGTSPRVGDGECMDVTDINEFRKKSEAREGSYDGAVCRHCGEAWFCLNGDPVGLVCVSRDGSITGYAGYLYCSACGRPHR
jgi:hypothetical protein